MTYAVFQYDRKNEADNRIKSISLMLLMQESRLKGFDVVYNELNIRKLSSNSHSRRSTHLATVAIAKTNAVTPNHTIVKLKDAQETAAETFAVLLNTPF